MEARERRRARGVQGDRLEEEPLGLGVERSRLDDGSSGRRACARSDSPSSATREMLR